MHIKHCLQMAAGLHQLPIAQQLDMCTLPFETTEQAEEIWRVTRAGETLDCIVQNSDQDSSGRDWLRQTLEVSGLGRGEMDCTTLTGAGCWVDLDVCQSLAREGNVTVFWILKSVSLLNLHLTEVNEQWIQNSRAENMLSVKTIEADFGPPPKDLSAEKALSIISTVFSFAAPLMGLAGPVMGMVGYTVTDIVKKKLDIASKTMSLGSNTFKLIGEAAKEPPEKGSDIEFYVRSYFNNTSYRMRQMMHDAIGVGNQSNLDTFLSDETEYRTRTAEFFAGGKWLVEDVGLELEPLLKEAGKLLKEKIIMMAFSPHYRMVVTNRPKPHWGNEGSCLHSRNNEEYWAVEWMQLEDESYCVWFEQNKYCGETQRKGSMWNMVVKHELKMKPIYQSIWDCERLKPDFDKEGAASLESSNSSFLGLGQNGPDYRPPCFHEMRVVFVYGKCVRIDVDGRWDQTFFSTWWADKKHKTPRERKKAIKENTT